MQRHLIVAVSAGFLSALLVSSAASTSAFFRRIDASACVSRDLLDENRSAGTVGLYNADATNNMNVHCPMLEDTTFDASDVVAVHVHINDGSTVDEVNAQTCYLAWDAIDGGCSTPDVTSTAGTGSETLTPPVWTAITNYAAGDHAYVLVNLCDDLNPARCGIQGIWASD